MLELEQWLTWSAWTPLATAGARGTIVPAAAGLYRIRRIGRDDLDYIGQTGMGTMTLRKRLAMLKGIYAAEMPYRDPHTAAPGLWALRHESGCDFEASVVAVAGNTAWRKGLEALAIALYRQQRGFSPTIEFGRVPLGYRASSANNRRLVERGLRVRGGPCAESLTEHIPGIAPAGPLTDHPQAPGWGGHIWSEWVPLTDVARYVIDGWGLYRIRGGSDDVLLYIGQGQVPQRPLAHLAKIGMPEHPQGTIFGTEPRLEVSLVLNGNWLAHHRLELENDLIGAHVLTTGAVPAAQFLG